MHKTHTKFDFFFLFFNCIYICVELSSRNKPNRFHNCRTVKSELFDEFDFCRKIKINAWQHGRALIERWALSWQCCYLYNDWKNIGVISIQRSEGDYDETQMSSFVEYSSKDQTFSLCKWLKRFEAIHFNLLALRRKFTHFIDIVVCWSKYSRCIYISAMETQNSISRFLSVTIYSSIPPEWIITIFACTAWGDGIQSWNIRR